MQSYLNPICHTMLWFRASMRSCYANELCLRTNNIENIKSKTAIPNKANEARKTETYRKIHKHSQYNRYGSSYNPTVLNDKY